MDISKPGDLYRRKLKLEILKCDPFSDVVRPVTGAVISPQGTLGMDINTNEGNAVSVNRKENVNIASA